MRILYSACCGLVLSLTAVVSAQSRLQPPPYGDYPTHVGATAASPEGIAEQKDTSESRVMRGGALAPAAADRKAFSTFLKQPNTGLMRLVPISASSTTILSSGVKSRVLGFYFSFVNVSHFNYQRADVTLTNDKLLVGNLDNSGLITRVGDVPLESITLDHPRAVYMSSYQPTFNQPDKRRRLKEAVDGFDVEGAHYSRMSPAEINQTYLLRSIIVDKSDALIALRVVRKESNGDVTIAWKLLKKFPKPQRQKGTRQI